jgi:hypothetical protein
VPKNMKILAIPLFELYDNSPRYVNLSTISFTGERFHSFCLTRSSAQVRPSTLRHPSFAFSVRPVSFFQRPLSYATDLIHSHYSPDTTLSTPLQTSSVSP